MIKKIDENVYVYHYMLDGDNAIEYCSIFYDKRKDAYLVIPDSCYNDFITNFYDSYFHVRVSQPEYSF